MLRLPRQRARGPSLRQRKRKARRFGARHRNFGKLLRELEMAIIHEGSREELRRLNALWNVTVGRRWMMENHAAGVRF